MQEVHAEKPAAISEPTWARGVLAEPAYTVGGSRTEPGRAREETRPPGVSLAPWRAKLNADGGGCGCPGAKGRGSREFHQLTRNREEELAPPGCEAGTRPSACLPTLGHPENGARGQAGQPPGCEGC